MNTCVKIRWVNWSAVFLASIWSALLEAQSIDWDAGYHAPGLVGGNLSTVNDMVEHGDFIYVTGDFDGIGEVAAEGIARYNKTTGQWSPLGTGFSSGWGNALLIDGDYLYVTGIFTGVDGVSAARIARWHIPTSTWSAIGSGLTGSSANGHALLKHGSEIYIGGEFTTGGGVTSQNVIKWNPTTNVWTAMGDGVGSTESFTRVFSLAASGTDVFVGGGFTKVTSVVGSDSFTRNIVRWDTATSTYHQLGGGVGGGVYDMLVDGSDLYVVGDFSYAGSASLAEGVARWNGTAWSVVGGPISGRPGADERSVSKIVKVGSDYYISGLFEAANGVDANSIARWNGSTWSALGLGLAGGGNSLLLRSNGQLWVGGRFDCAGNVGARGLASWNPSTATWNSVVTGKGFGKRVHAMLETDDHIYVGGGFNAAGDVPANGVARLVKATHQWEAVGGELISRRSMRGTSVVGGSILFVQTNSVNALALVGSTLYAAGGFGTWSGGPAGHVARWNGATWEALGTGLNNTTGSIVYSMAVDGSQLYVGGLFETAGGQPAANVARWNTSTSTWSALGDGVNGTIFSLRYYNGVLYAGGNFTEAGGNPAKNVARWTGSTWQPMAAGLPQAVRAFEVLGSTLYAAHADRVSRWTGSAWVTLPDVSFSTIYDLDASGGKLYGGSSIQAWDGTAWSFVGSGQPGEMEQIAVDGTRIYTAGLFSSFGGSLSPSNFAAGTIIPAAPPEPPELDPFPAQTWIVSGTVNEQLTIQPNVLPVTFKASGLPPGVKLNAVTGVISGKPTKSGYYTLKLWATNKAGSSPFQYVVVDVVPLPLNTQGTFNGLVTPDPGLGENLGGSISLTVAGTGSFSGSLLLGGRTYKFKGVLDTTTTPTAGRTVIIPLKGGSFVTLVLSINPSTGQLYGTITNEANTVTVAFSGWKNAWRGPFTTPSLDYAGTYNVALEIDTVNSPGVLGNVSYPQGQSYGTAKVSKTGSVTWSGRMADNSVITFTSGLGPNGQFFIHRLLYGSKGILSGQLFIDSMTGVITNDPWAGTPLAWFKTTATTPARSYISGFPRHRLLATGSRYTKPLSNTRALNLPDADPNGTAYFTQGGLMMPWQNAFTWSLQNKISPSAPVSYALKLEVATSTGLITGSYTYDTGRVAKVYALIIPSLGEARGFFILPETSAKTSALLSGAVEVTP
ncbi:MAG: putative Ig domain-containing protein [Verrucomicrobiaceae bacterium]|nr:putative Ig domain-containing protein [Verrucomicrobiaceae bacterium]